jgi:hypothetical protein
MLTASATMRKRNPITLEVMLSVSDWAISLKFNLLVGYSSVILFQGLISVSNRNFMEMISRNAPAYAP